VQGCTAEKIVATCIQKKAAEFATAGGDVYSEIQRSLYALQQ
jgi:hypothetical protein